MARPLAVLSIVLAGPSAAGAQSLMTFTPIACATGETNFVPEPYTEAGFTLTTGTHAFFTWCADSPNYGGPGMFVNQPGSNVNLTKSDGGTFSIDQIWLAHLNGGTWGAQAFTFTGNLTGGGVILQTFTIGAQAAGNPVFMPFNFDAGWTNLINVSFSPQNYSYYQFTNILLDAGPATTVPEPASMALLGTGLVGVFAAARRRRN
jgi:hypothetical protein